jgi:hypothetical protein
VTAARTLTYRGPERRRAGLLECPVCERRLRPHYFRAIDAATGQPGLCDDCVAVRHEQVGDEMRERFVPWPTKIQQVIRDKDGNIAEVREFERGSWSTRAIARTDEAVDRDPERHKALQSAYAELQVTAQERNRQLVDLGQRFNHLQDKHKALKLKRGVEVRSSDG